VIGKACHYRAAEGGAVLLEEPGLEHRSAPSVPTATCAVAIDRLDDDSLRALLSGGRFSLPAQECLSLDRFGYVAGPPTGGWRQVLRKPFKPVDV
jgi:hypothetical protein